MQKQVTVLHEPLTSVQKPFAAMHEQLLRLKAGFAGTKKQLFRGKGHLADASVGRPAPLGPIIRRDEQMTWEKPPLASVRV